MSDFTFDLTSFILIFGSLFCLLFIIACIYCYCWKKQIDRRLSRLGLSVSDLERENGRPINQPVTVDSADSLWCGWCRYWWGDGSPPPSQTSTSNRPLKDELDESHDESNDVLCNLNQSKSSHENTRSNSVASIRAQYLRESPRLSKGSLYSRTSISDTRSVPISQGGRRISHDPFTLCQDLQVLETRRRSEAFMERRKSEQLQNRRRSSIAQPPPLMEARPDKQTAPKDKKKQKSLEHI